MRLLDVLSVDNQWVANCVLKLASPAQILIVSSSLLFCFRRFSMRKLKKAFALAMACSTQTLDIAVLQRRWLVVRGLFFRALTGLKINFGVTYFSIPVKPESTWTRKQEKVNSAKVSLKMVKSCTCPSYILLTNKIRRNWSQMSNHFTVCCFFYRCIDCAEHLDLQRVLLELQLHQ